MVRRYEAEEEKRGSSFVYWLAIILIIMAWAFAFKIYFSSYENLHPDIAWAAPGMNRNIAEADGVYLWDETVLAAPIAGKVYYPKGKGPVRVAFGETVAKIVSETAVKEIRAFQQGYFVAGTDGKEGNWRYSLIWPDLEKLPEVASVNIIEEGSPVMEKDLVGKLVPQPQELRFIGLVESSTKMKKQLEKKELRYMMDKEDTPAPATVDISAETGDKIKFLAKIPCFNAELLLNRRGKIIVETGHEEGSVVPVTAVTTRHGKPGVFLVKGTRVVFQEIEGHEIEDNRYLVTDGVIVGEAIVENAENAKEGRIQIW